MNGLWQRLLSAFIAIAILFSTAGFGGSQALLPLSIFILIYATREFIRASALGGVSSFLKVLFLVSTGLSLVASSYSDFQSLPFLIFTAYTLVFILCQRNEKNISMVFQRLLAAHFGFILCAYLPSFALKILPLQQGLTWFFCFLGVVFIGDTAAYFGGLTFGRSKIAPHISPKKTWAGSISGLGGSLGVGLVSWYWFFQESSLLGLAVFGILVGALGQAGDLVASLFKRASGIKDSGRLMPGHGGLLDRIDGALLAGPAAYFMIELLQRI